MIFEEKITPIKTFNFDGEDLPVSFVETTHEAAGVDCDVYTILGDTAKDLGVIRMRPGSKTHLQRVLNGERTIERYILGKGKLILIKPDGRKEIYIAEAESQEPFSVLVEVGEFMQWEADKNSELIVYEICFPPYKDGRYENIA